MAKLVLQSYCFSLCFLFLLLCEEKPIAALSRDDFPSDFIFGAGTSALQVSLSLIGFHWHRATKFHNKIHTKINKKKKTNRNDAGTKIFFIICCSEKALIEGIRDRPMDIGEKKGLISG
ncbi:hypothetical protein FCM35_KLT20635 [Carex littledalei]|uniref:Beta-glucosidase n=1 Tax=Carex littledalei TaxID=544730 RepID=A0A833RIU7_9POAL|nr:hypothetical protein FCM35_KLT20635 [Carex littledalei]